MPTYRTSGPWGSGIGRNLTAAEADTNIYDLDTAVTDLNTSRPQPNEITSISVDQTTLTFHFGDGSTMSVPAPILQFHYRGSWQPDTIYQALDVFIADGVGEFSVLVDHTSAATFDQNATDGSGAPLYLFMLPMAGSGGGVPPFSISSPADGDVMRYSASAVAWINAAVSTLLLSALGDVALTSLLDGEALTWSASAGKWVNTPVSGAGGGTVTSVVAGIGLLGGTITSAGTISMPNSGVTSGNYTMANITVDPQGRVTAAASGTPGTPAVVSKTANYTVTTADSGTHFDNIGATAAVTFTLPAAASGLAYTFLVDAAQTINLQLAAGDALAIGTSNSATGAIVSSGSPFSYIAIEAHRSGQWVTTSLVGTWG